MGCGKSKAGLATSPGPAHEVVVVREPAEQRFLEALRQSVDDDGALTDTAERALLKLIQARMAECSANLLSAKKEADKARLASELERWQHTEQSAIANVPTAEEMGNAATVLELQRSYFAAVDEQTTSGAVSDGTMVRLLGCFADDVEGQDRVHGTKMLGNRWEPYRGIREAEARWRAWFALTPQQQPKLPTLKVKSLGTMMVMTERPERIRFSHMTVMPSDSSFLRLDTALVFNAEHKIESVVHWWDKRCAAQWQALHESPARRKSSIVSQPKIRTSKTNIVVRPRAMPQTRFSTRE